MRLGLLDEQERKDFETAFAAASPRVQQLIRDQQLLEARQQIASLPEVIQPVSLRERVLSKVFGLISAETGVAGRIDHAMVDPGLNRRLGSHCPRRATSAAGGAQARSARSPRSSPSV